MSTQLDIVNSSLFDILYEIEPPNNTRYHGPGREPGVVADNIALRIQYEWIFRGITETTETVQLTL